MTEVEERLQEYFFPVEASRIYYTGKENQVIGDNVPYKGIIHGETGELISIVKNSYRIVPNKQVIEPLIEELSQLDTNWFIDNSHSFVEPAKMKLHITFPDLTYNDGESDTALSMYLHNSYDGTSGIKMLWGAIRAICTNGMIFGRVLARYRSKHTKNYTTNKILTQLEATYESIPIIKERIEILKNIPVSEAEIESVKENISAGALNYVLVSGEIQNRWVLYNVLTEYISHNVKQRMRTDYQMRVSKMFNF